MENIYSNKEDDLDFEKYICFEKPELWLNEANNLFYSAEVLYEFESYRQQSMFGGKNQLDILFTKDLCERFAFNYRNQRMLWAYGFENVFKGIILMEIADGDRSISRVPTKRIKSHNLTYLAKQASIISENDDTFYLGILEKCSLWAGRYPLPVKSQHMYEKRAPMNSQAELFERSKKICEDYVNGKIKRTECESDVLHSSIGQFEIEYYKELKMKSITIFKNAIEKKKR